MYALRLMPWSSHFPSLTSFFGRSQAGITTTTSATSRCRPQAPWPRRSPAPYVRRITSVALPFRPRGAASSPTCQVREASAHTTCLSGWTMYVHTHVSLFCAVYVESTGTGDPGSPTTGTRRSLIGHLPGEEGAQSHIIILLLYCYYYVIIILSSSLVGLCTF